MVAGHQCVLHGGWGNELVTWWWGISVFYMVGGAMSVLHGGGASVCFTWWVGQ